MINNSGVAASENNQNSPKAGEEELKPIASLSFPFKTFEYHTVREILIPFDKKLCNNAKFMTPLEAMMYIRDHCHRNGINFKRSIALKFANLCQVYDQVHGSYICMDSLSHTVLNQAFTKVSRLASTKVLKYL
ncbi:hypothetical protein TVAG_167860 [Trichomonas vaginalis G3]|uniref:Uncharacterized protein n=1 Tax=Trichomonas vaginalis (strain ATCC PRA-98 / G3) TaxID=412133 RepID=A2FLC3_TRIV3|nr:hypothetical protein TVAGG3_0717540 [Trichomonas vaginalis G3]EAX94304.1 hypothetical protein TVAG_167860 [Trichomonas vaginalis G3]KAI5510350.1 hypothetical protein TVAGG3_0717540 [Trichomonas vaginalis G3]|eukprot:XP_001307234.1 hypothetical protein [Trichomonas vaginalis G3]